MPYVQSNSNVRKRRAPRRFTRLDVRSGEWITLTPVSLSGAASFGLGTREGWVDLTQSDAALRTPVEDTDRPVRFKLFFTGYLDVAVEPVDPASRFVMLKRVSPVMTDPTINENGKPE